MTTPKEKAAALALKCARELASDSAHIPCIAAIISRVLALEEMEMCVEALRKIHMADEAAIEELKQFYPGVEVRTELAECAKQALSALEAKRGGV